MGYELYVITDPTLAGGLSHEEIARLAIEGGADAMQLRDKKCDKQHLVATGRHMRKVTRDANVLLWSTTGLTWHSPAGPTAFT